MIIWDWGSGELGASAGRGEFGVCGLAGSFSSRFLYVYIGMFLKGWGLGDVGGFR